MTAVKNGDRKQVQEGNGMTISKKEAQESLSQIGDTVERTKKMVAYGGGDILFIVWGVIWVLGYVGW